MGVLFSLIMLRLSGLKWGCRYWTKIYSRSKFDWK